jgi:hypothetical protein
MKGEKIKYNFKGIFSLRCEMQVLYAFAFTKRQAWLIFCRRLAKKYDVHISHVMKMFDGSKDNYSITIETEYKESEV